MATLVSNSLLSQRAKACVENLLGPDATLEDMAQLTVEEWLRMPNIGKVTAREIRKAIKNPNSLSLAGLCCLTRAERRSELRNRGLISARYVRIHQCRDGGMTYAQIGKNEGISPSRVAQIYYKVERKLHMFDDVKGNIL